MNLLTTNQAAARLGISSRRVRAMIEAGTITAHQLGHEYAIEEKALDGVTVHGKAGRPPKVQAADTGAKRATKKGGKTSDR